MKKLFVIAVFALALNGCVSPEQEGVSYTMGGLGPATDAAKIGDGKWLISCYDQLSGCTWRANQSCPGGFEVTSTSANNQSSGSVTTVGAAFQTATQHVLGVSCK